MKKLILLILLLCSFNAKPVSIKPLLMSVGLAGTAYAFCNMLDNSEHRISYRRAWNIGLSSLVTANYLYLFEKRDSLLNLIVVGFTSYDLYLCCKSFINSRE